MLPLTEIALLLNLVVRDTRLRCMAGSRCGRTTRLCVVALPALLLFAVGCANQGPSLGPAPQTIHVGTELAAEQVINRHLEDEPRTLDPSLTADSVGFMVTDDLFEGLVTVGEDGSTIPGVATSWETSADGKTWTFHLRKDARWSNGAPVTSNDFVYAWRREVDPATGSEYAQALAPIENALDIASGKMPVDRLGVESVGPQTLLVHLNAPTPYFLALLTNVYLYPEYEPAVKQWGDAWTQPGHMVSNGPFVLSEHVINGHITLLKNPYYSDASHVRLSKVNYVIVVDYTATTNQYVAGDIDFTDRVAPSEKERLQQLLGNQLVLSPYFATAMFSFNVAKPPFAGNPKLRQALNIALDRDILSKYVRRGIGVPAYNIMPPLAGYDPAVPDWAKLPTDERHALALKLYHEAGYSDSHPLETVLTYMSGGAETRRFMEALSAMWQTNLGANVQIYNVEWKVFLQAKQLKQPVLYWDAWTGDYADPFTFMQLFQTGNGMNDGDYHNPQFDALVDRANTTNDVAAHFQLFHQAEAMLNEDVPTLPVYYYMSSHLIKPYVKGWQSNVMDRNVSRYMYILAHTES